MLKHELAAVSGELQDVLAKSQEMMNDEGGSWVLVGGIAMTATAVKDLIRGEQVVVLHTATLYRVVEQEEETIKEEV